jgi:hypothetical protein
MLKKLPKWALSLPLAFSAALFNTGCSTPKIEHSFGDDCMIGSKARASLLFVFALQSDSGDTYSKSCYEGQLAAKTTLIGRSAQGQLHPVGALFALEFKNIIKENLNVDDEGAKKHWQEVDFFFDFFLKQKSGLSIKEITEYVEHLKETRAQRERAEREAARQAELAEKAAEEERQRRARSIQERCIRQGGIVSCTR